jgi:hypothetical protein
MVVGRPTSRVSRVLVSGPLAGFVEAYEAELKVRGYTPRSAVGKLQTTAPSPSRSAHPQPR